MDKIFISACAASNVGKKRLNNEDNYYLNDNYVNSQNEAFSELNYASQLVVSVCDGMGGEEAGEIASQLAVETVHKYEQKLILSNCSNKVIEKIVGEANNLICEKIKTIKSRMGTTFTLLGINDGVATISNIGDSRVYKYYDGCLEQISHDHTEAQTLVDAGIISKEESMKIKEKHRLTQHLGIFPYEMIIEPYIVKEKVKIGEKFLLCSDGLTDMLSEPEIVEVLAMDLPINEAVNLLISRALENGGKDNVTIILCEIFKNKEPLELIPANSTKIKNVKKSASTSKSLRFSVKKFIKISIVILLIITTFICCNKISKSLHKHNDKIIQTTTVQAVKEETTKLQLEIQTTADQTVKDEKIEPSLETQNIKQQDNTQSNTKHMTTQHKELSTKNSNSEKSNE